MINPITRIRSFNMPILTLVLGLCACTAQAQIEDEKYYFNIGADTVGEALKTFAIQTDSEILFTASIVKDKNTLGVQGEYTNQEALQRILADTELSIEKSDEKVYLIYAENEPVSAVGQQGSAEGGVRIQDDQGKKGVASRGIEEVVVTANKREQNLQDVAFGLSALNGGDLNRLGASGAEDYLATIPGVSYSALGRSQSILVVRGISTEGNSINNLASTTAVYVDDLPSLARWQQWTNTDPNTYDLERVEVLRGPQGTLFGSGALGGALRVITNKPDTSEFAANVELGYAVITDGDTSNNISGMVNIPLIDDTLALRVVGYTRSDGGYVDNIARGEEDVNSGETDGWRAMLAYEPTEDLSIRLTAMHQADLTDDASDSFQDSVSSDIYEYDNPIPRITDVSLDTYNLSVEYDFGSTLLTSSTTSANRDSITTIGLNQLLDSIFGGGVDPNETDDLLTNEINSFVQEIRLTSQSDSALEWTLGAFYFEQDIDGTQVVGSDNVAGNFIDSVYSADITEQALFGEATYHLTDQISFTAGARGFDNAFDFEVPVSVGTLSGPPTALVTQNESAVTPKFSLSYRPAEDVHLYATASQGYRLGQVNFGATVENAIPLTFNHDELWNYEIGLKSLLLDKRMKFNAGAFYIDWSGIQLTRLATLSNGLDRNFTDNAGNAISKGIEVELTYLPTEDWELGSAFTYTDARLDSVLDGVSLTPGSTLPGTPDISMFNYAQYSLNELPNDMTGYVRLSHRYVGESYSNIVNSDVDKSDSYHKLDLRAGVNFGQYEVAVYVDNLADEDAAAYRNTNAALGLAPRAIYLQPRTVGMTFRADF